MYKSTFFRVKTEITVKIRHAKYPRYYKKKSYHIGLPIKYPIFVSN